MRPKVKFVRAKFIEQGLCFLEQVKVNKSKGNVIRASYKFYCDMFPFDL